VESQLAGSQSTVTSLEDEVKQRVQETEDVRSQLQQLTAQHDVNHCSVLIHTVTAFLDGGGDGLDMLNEKMIMTGSNVV